MEMKEYLYVPDYADGVIYKFDKNIPRKEIWEYFNSFSEAKDSLIDYYDKLLSDTKSKLSGIKKLKETPNQKAKKL